MALDDDRDPMYQDEELTTDEEEEVTPDEETPETLLTYQTDALALAQTDALFRGRAAPARGGESPHTFQAVNSPNLPSGLPSLPPQTRCSMYWAERGNKPGILLAMSIGLTDGSGERPGDGDDRRLADFSLEPYLSVPQRSPYNPTQLQLSAEVQKRHLFERSTGRAKKDVQSAGWIKQKCIDWLLAHPPIISENDIAFLRREEQRIYDTLMEIKDQEAAKEREKSLNWGSHKPWLRLYCCLLSEEARPALLTKDNTYQNREQNDARNNEEYKPESFEAVVAGLFNDPSYICVTEALPHLGCDLFMDTVQASRYDVPSEDLQPKDVNKKVSEARARIMKVWLFSSVIVICSLPVTIIFVH